MTRPRPEPAGPRPVVLDRVRTARGELCLRRVGEDLEIVSNGVFLMATGGGRSERVMVDRALARRPGARRLVVAGLGVGHTLARACAHPALQRITVVEVEPVVVDWHRRHFSPWVGRPLDDDRVTLRIQDVATWLARDQTPVDAVCLDVDNGPGWTVHADNDRLYGGRALERWHARLAPGGVLAVWSAHAAPAFARALRARFAEVDEVRVPAPRGEDDRIYLGVRGAA